MEIDFAKDLAELSETNNVMIKTIECTPPMPDLVVNRLQILDGCKLKITLKNIGTAGVPDIAYGTSSSAVQWRITVDGSPIATGWLSTLDSTRALKTPGAYSNWTWNRALPPGSREVKVEIDFAEDLAELSETNNMSMKSVNCE